ncbi:MAG TPA: GYF domain-containing protein [Anaeromyxobacteraceae bacterium]
MGDAIWWYEWEGRQAGPVEHGALVELVRSGRLRGEARVWRSGMPGWEALRNVPEVAIALPSARPDEPLSQTYPPPPGRGASTPTPTATATATVPALPDGMEPVSTGALLGLGVVTLGIYPIVKFYQAGAAYQALAGRPSRFATWFWLAIGLGLVGGPLLALGGFLGFTAHIAAIAFTVLTLFELLALRAEILKRYALAPVLTSDGTHKALFISGLLTWWFVVGLVLLAVQTVKLFDDHRAIGDALRARRAAASVPPREAGAPLAPGLVATPGARTCAGCGNALAPPARFCDRCGRPVEGPA